MTYYEIKVKNHEKTAVLRAAAGVLLADLLSENGFAVPAACGRRGICGKCSVTLLSGGFTGVSPDKNGCIKSCRAIVCANAEIELSLNEGSGLTDFAAEEKSAAGKCGIAVDIGTTTVAAAFRSPDGSVKTASCLNPQSAFGADVISRIAACSDGHPEEQTELIRECVAGLIKKLDPNREAGELTVAGNTTMLHIFCGVSPVSMGMYPFTPVFTDARQYSGADLGMPVKKVIVLPSVSAFIGSDVVAGIFALGLADTCQRVLFADLGTNGELVFSNGGRLFCTSTAAGPALEGACIECGTGGVSGAVNRVYKKNGILCCSAIGGVLPTGICGAGLTDAVAVLLNDGVIDETGYMEDDFYLTDSVYITPRDIRQFQLAKSAVCSGAETLLDYAGITKTAVDKIFIAGGLGYYIDPVNAVKSGIFAGFDAGKINAAGNTSLKGALLCIGEPSVLEKMSKLAKSCTPVDLGGNPSFSARFAENMLF